MERPTSAEDESSAQRSVLQRLGPKLGFAPAVHLREEAAEPGGTPVVKPGGAHAQRALPKGRGNYQLLGEIARGGMGVVLKGHDTDLGRDVALKVLHEKLAGDPAVLSRFVEEAQIGGQLQHPGIVPVYELGLMADERPYFTMKLVKGRTLSSLLDERESPAQDLRRFLGLFEQVCLTVAYAHSRSVVHRDLKPLNVMVGAFGEVQVVDWGLAKVLGAHADRTGPESAQASVVATVRSGGTSSAADSVVGSVMGTPPYMSPEQARGEVEGLDERTDVFALGSILCEILTGKPAYPGPFKDAIDLAQKHDLGDAHARLARCVADAALVQLVSACLAQDVADRPRNAGVVAARVSAHLASVEERAQRARIRAARIVSLAVAAVLFIAVGAGGWLWREGRRAEQQRETRAKVASALSEAILARGRHDFAAARTALGRARAYAEGEAATPEMRAQVAEEEQVARLEERGLAAARESEERRQDFRRELARIRLAFDEDQVAAYERAFAAIGFDPETLTADELVARAAELDLRIEIASALDYWSGSAYQPQELARFLAFQEKAAAVEPDAQRTRLRRAIVAGDFASYWRIAMEIARSADFPRESASFLIGGLVNTGRVDLAREVSAIALRRYPGDLGVRAIQLFLYSRMDPPRWEECLVHLEVARALDPESVWVPTQQALVLDSMGAKERAADAIRVALELDPAYARGHFLLGGYLADLGRADEAQASLRTALELDPQRTTYAKLGEMLFRARAYAGAREALETAIFRWPEDVELKHDLAWMLLTADDPAERDTGAALRLAETAAAAGDVPEYLDTLGLACVRAGRFADAVSALQRAARLPGGDARPENAYVLALAFAALDDPAEALRQYELGRERAARDGRGAAAREAIESLRVEVEQALGD